MLEHFARRLQEMIWSIRPPTALVSAPTSNPIVFCLFPLLLNTFLAEMQPSMPSLYSGTLASLARQSNKLLQSVTTRMGKCSLPIRPAKNSSSNQHLTQHCSRVFCHVQSISTRTGISPKSRQDGSFRRLALPGHERYWNGFGFLEIVLIHHTDQGTMLRTNTDTLLLGPRRPFIV